MSPPRSRNNKPAGEGRLPFEVWRFAAAYRRNGSGRWPFRSGRYEMASRMASMNLKRAEPEEAVAASGVPVNAGENNALREILRSLFDAALDAADPARAVAAHMPAPVAGRTVVIGAGKASAAMARAFEANWSGPLDQLGGLVVTRRGHAVPCARIEIVEASHPVPDLEGEAAAR